jgi:glycopeptide antibiotics resistance protein
MCVRRSRRTGGLRVVQIGPGGFIAVAVLVFAAWRIVRWRSAGGDIVRESVVVTLFAYMLAVACVTFFPMSIIFYDWHGRFSLVPLASIADLVLHATAETALKNIGGNIVMFVPLGLLLPMLFRRLRSLGSLVWRVALISAAIEALQLPTRVRATDVDDIILNVVGAVIGYGLFRVVGLVAARLPRVSAFLDRVGVVTQREPLLAAAVPVVATVVLTLGFIVPPILSGTLDESAIRRDVMSGMAGPSVAARADAGGFVVLVAKSGEATSAAYRYAEYKRVLPGRYTRTCLSDVCAGVGSRYALGITAFKPSEGEVPLIYVVGRNDSGASTLVASAKGGRTVFDAPVGRYFAVALPMRSGFEDADVGVAFRSASGCDVTRLFTNE